ncbi:MAG: CvpA family protein [Oscillospiraceae bacterium]|nr:CvpA family protein [Oscillospiraceae bacterium]
MSLLIDIVLVALFLLGVILGWRHGFIKTAVKIVGFFVALFVAFQLGGLLGGVVYDSAVAPPLHDAVVSRFDAGSATAQDGVQAALDKLPSFMQSALASAGLPDAQTITAKLDVSADASANAVSSAIIKTLRPILGGLIGVVIGLLLFIGLYIIVCVLARVLNRVFKLPLLKQINGLLGAVLGLVQGAVFVLIAVTVLQLIANSGGFVSRDDMANSRVAGWVSSVNPLYTTSQGNAQ